MVRLVLFLVVGLALLAIVAGWLGYTSWLVRSGIDELARRRRIIAGVDPLQITARKTVDSAAEAHDSAHAALSMTVEAWYALRESRAVGTALVGHFPAIEARAARDRNFLDALESATDALNESAVVGPASAGELIDRAATLDSLNLQLRQLVYEYRSHGRRRFGRFFPGQLRPRE